MRASQFVIATLKEAPSDAKINQLYVIAAGERSRVLRFVVQ